MPEIVLPKKMDTEFGIAGGIITLVAYCVHPLDVTKHNEMVKVLNIWVREKFTNIDLNKYKDDLDNPDKADKFWNELKDFAKRHSVDVCPSLPSIITPRQYAEKFVASLYDMATNNLELPANVTKFLLEARSPTPVIIKAEMESIRPAIGTCMLIVLKLAQMHKTPPDVLRGGVSLNKAIDLLMLKKSGCPIKNTTGIKRAWASYKKSTPISFGLLLAFYFVHETKWVKELNKGKYLSDYLSPPALGLVLVFSKFIEWFLLSLPSSPHVRSSRFMKPNQLWLMPKKVNPQNLLYDKMLSWIPPLTDAELAVLKGKRR